MENSKSTLGLTGQQLANGTPSDKLIVLKAFYKDDKCTISPAKDPNGRYLGINENIPEIKKLEMGYVPSIESRIKLYDGIEIDLNNVTWAKDWEWMQHCNEIADDFKTGQAAPGAYFYIFRPGFESARRVSDMEQNVQLMNYVLNDTPDNLYNRASILGVDMTGSVLSDVKDFLLSMVITEPAKIRAVYESKTFALELLFMHAIAKNVIADRAGVYVFGEILLGVEDKAVVAYFANPKNLATTKAIEALTYGAKKVVANPLEDEARGGEEDEDIREALQEAAQQGGLDDTLKVTTLDDQATHTENTSDAKAEDFQNDNKPAERALTPQEKAKITREANAAAAAKK